MTFDVPVNPPTTVPIESAIKALSTSLMLPLLSILPVSFASAVKVEFVSSTSTKKRENIAVAPIPDQAYAVQLNYIIDPPHFTSTNNTFLSTYQDAMLLYGVLTETFSFLKGPQDMYNLYKSRYNEAIQAFAMQQMGRRRRAEYDDGVPRVKIDSPSPNTIY